MTVAQCLDYWFDNYVSTTLREKTQALYRSTVMKRMHDAFPNRPASSITVKQWVDLLTEEERDNPRRARQVLSQLRSAISWCMRRQLIDSCAIMSIQPRDFGSRAEVGDRVLSYHELAKIWLAIERSRASTSNKLLHQMLMLWGARLSELRLATKTEFDLLDNVWTVPKEHSKMGNVIRRPIFEQIKPLVTRLSEMNVEPHVTERMLGHELGGIMSVYNKHDWIEAQRKAYELHADKLFWHIRSISG